MAESQAFLDRLNKTILILGVAAIAFGALIFSLISRAMTRPLENVVAGVKALAGGDYGYSIQASGSREVKQLGEAFAAMRTQLLESQQHQLAEERMTALGRTASSISHDLRHYLAAVVANAEFLYEAESLNLDREEVYREIKIASDQMVDLIDSLRELSRVPASLVLVESDLEDTIRRAIDAVDLRRDFRHCDIDVHTTGDMRGVFDPRKMERVFFNLILNACESTIGKAGVVRIDAAGEKEAFRVRVADNGCGIPEALRENLFDPFVSSGKTNGTGLGLAIVSKILGDHQGSAVVESTSQAGTAIVVTIPHLVNIPGADASTVNPARVA